MTESVLDSLNVAERSSAKAPEGAPPKRSSKAFNSFQIAQAQFDKVAEYLGLIRIVDAVWSLVALQAQALRTASCGTIKS